MKTKAVLKIFSLGLLITGLKLPVFAQGTAFTYQGRLTDGASPANGSYDLKFSLWDASSGPSQTGGIITNSATAVSNGLFTVSLDFGNQFPGANRWLEIGVRTNGGGSFVTLAPRQQLSATPYAITAGDVTGANIARLSLSNTAVQATGHPVVTSGFITGAIVDAGGAGYTTPPTVTVNDSTGSGAVISATVSNGAIVSLTVNNAGGSYSPAATLTIGVPPNGARQTFAGTNFFSGVNTLTNQNNTFGGDGSGLSGLWRTSGNAGTAPGAQFLGTTDNQPLEFKVNGLRALRLENNGDSSDVGTTPDGAPNVIGGSPGNFVAAGIVGATIAGGGATNFSGIPYTNSVSANFAAIGGGLGNTIQTGSPASTIGGGEGNMIQTNVDHSTIGGGDGNTIQAGSDFSTIGAGVGNTIQANAARSTISGGEANTIQASAVHSTIGGGINNTIASNVVRSTIGGGLNNTIQAGAYESAIGGGYFNRILTNAYQSTIGGGNQNTASDNNATIGGGVNNTASGNNATVGGGDSNTASGGNSTVGGGDDNNASGVQATVSGGSANTASSTYATVGGGVFNTASGQYATIPGGDSNSATNSAFAAGHRAKANHTGAFVWADSTEADFASGAANQFLIRASGGVGIGTTAPEADLHVFRGSAGAVTANPTAPLVVESDGNAFINLLSPSNAISGLLFGSPISAIDASIRYNNSGTSRELSFRTLNSQRMVILTNGFVGIGISAPTNTLHVNGGVSATAFVNTSDRNAKENFVSVSPREILNKVAALPITTWNFKTMNDGRHMGPMAQDFYAAFGLGGGDTTITSVDPDGVALAAIQGLNQKVEKENSALRAENAELKERLEKLERLFDEKTNRL